MYFPRVDAETGKLVSLEMVPMQMKKFRLNRPSRQDVMWLRETLSREGQPLGTRVTTGDGDTLVLHWEGDLPPAPGER
jgi:poly-gamma-glutamate capsule biosynthesis protein CapA/YwtB (metallophosphatase superfamily)